MMYRYQMMFCYEYCKGEPTLEIRQDMYNPKSIYKNWVRMKWKVLDWEFKEREKKQMADLCNPIPGKEMNRL